MVLLIKNQSISKVPESLASKTFQAVMNYFCKPALARVEAGAGKILGIF
jgi:hypothetical protein